jgi:hypothetical protein
MRDYAMFSAAGNAAVAHLVEEADSHFDDRLDAWEWVIEELTALGTTSSFSEALDTAVREAVYEELTQRFPTAMFKSIRV